VQISPPFKANNMSIEINNPKTLLEKVDAAANLVEQMFLAHMVKDEKMFSEAHNKASKLLFDACRMAEKLEK
jgi:hypothetical protein